MIPWLLILVAFTSAALAAERPNILFAIADDWGLHASAYGTRWVKTPAFDRVAREGLLFNNAYTPNAKCAPSRACLLTGRNSWQLKAAANHIPYFPPEFKGWGEALAEKGWFVGHTMKGWGPGMATNALGQPRQMTGVAFNKRKAAPASSAQALSYQWQRAGTNIPGATNSSLVFSSLQDSDDGVYRVQVSTMHGSILSDPATVVAIHAPSITNQVPALDLRVPQMANVTLTVGVRSKGWANPKYSWTKDGAPVPTGIQSSLDILARNVLAEGAYQVVVSNPAGSATSGVWQVKVTLRGEAAGWGDNTVGQLTSARTETNLVAVAAGAYHNLGLRENGTVVQWGYSWTNVPAGLTNVVALSAGYVHSLALREDGTVAAWGDPEGDANYVPTNLTGVKAIAAAWNHNVALLNNGTVTAWGNNWASLGWNLTNVPPGLTNVIAISASTLHSLALRADGTVVAWGNNADGQTNVPVGLSNVVAVAAGGMHSLALRADGTVTNWGGNGYGQCDVPSGLSNVLAISAGFEHSIALKNDGSVVAWGHNNDGQATVPNGLGDTYRIAAGLSHSVALAYEPALNYQVDVSRDLMLICNTNSSDSTNLMSYYLAHRPGVSNAIQLRIGGYAGESYTNVNDFTNGVLNETLNWYTNNPTKRPAYIVCFLDVPTRIDEPQIGNRGLGSVGTELRKAIGHRPPFVTYINMGAPPVVPAETNRLPDCYAYIDKLARFGSNYAPGKIVISASAAGYQNDTYMFDDEARFYECYVFQNCPAPDTAASTFVLRTTVLPLLALGVLSNRIDYLPGTTETIRYGTNLAGYMSHGVYGWDVDYPVLGKVRFRGASQWYIIATAESFNGTRNTLGHGSYAEWYWRGAFDRSDHEGTPVGVVCHVSEPGLTGVQDGSLYFGNWAKGKRFAVCAWLSGKTPHLLVVGDPLVRR